jgi:hypothetical protein
VAIARNTAAMFGEFTFLNYPTEIEQTQPREPATNPNQLMTVLHVVESLQPFTCHAVIH